MVSDRTKDFVSKATEVHGMEYDYSQVQFTNRRTAVEIICSLHGAFLQTPEKHLLGRGCHKCGGTAKKTTVEFVADAIAEHGDRYDYSLVDYKNKSTEVRIICASHGEFQQLPVVHLRGGLCQKCANENRGDKRRLGSEEMIARFVKAHGDEYDYSELEYVNTRTPVRIKCKKHGAFYQLPYEHIEFSGCKSCHPRDYGYLAKFLNGSLQARKAELLSAQQIAERAFIHHGHKFDYSAVKTAKRSDTITIQCPKHGKFSQVLQNHILGSGCKQCGYENSSTLRAMSFEEFVQRATQVHDGIYTYNAESWAGTKHKTIVTCPSHGEFSQLAGAHLAGAGCPACGLLRRSEARRQDKDALLERMKSRHDGEYEYDLSDFRSVNTDIPIHCKTHGWFNQTPNNHLQGKGCPSCRNEKIGSALRDTPEDVITKFRRIHGNDFDYSLVAMHYKNTDTPVPIICPKHGEFWQIPYNHLNGRRCPICKESRGELEVRLWLEKRGIEYIKEWTEHDCVNIKPLKFDFFLPDFEAVIEFDGIQHFDPDVRWWEPDPVKRQAAFELLQLHDWLKDAWCAENKIDLIRISYHEDVERCLCAVFGAE